MTRPGKEHVTAWRSRAGNEPPPSERELELGCASGLDIGLDVIDEAVHRVWRGAAAEPVRERRAGFTRHNAAAAEARTVRRTVPGRRGVR